MEGINALNQDAKARAVNVALPSDWTMNERQMCDLEMILSGAFAPLKGFMTIQDYQNVLDNMTLANGEIFSLPVVLAIPKNCCGEKTTTNVFWMKSTTTAKEFQGSTIKLRDSVGCVIAELNVESVYSPCLEEELMKVAGTIDDNHPHVRYVYENYKDCYYVGGTVEAVNPIHHFNFMGYRISPQMCREYIQRKGYDVVVGFQTRNPLHRCHYELIKNALNKAANDENKRPLLFLSPVVGPTQNGDVPYHLRVRCYEHVLQYFSTDKQCAFESLCPTAVSTPHTEKTKEMDLPVCESNINNVNPANNYLLALIPLAMRMAGPRECVLHARIRKNYGCTHFIVGRDHAGPSSRKKDGTPFYGPYDAHKVLARVSDRLGITPIFGEEMMYVGEANGGYVSAGRLEELRKKNPSIQVENISGTEFRRRLRDRQNVPEWFSFPQVVSELHTFFEEQHRRGLCIYFTGLPCSGKSTLANALEAAILENKAETRKITVLDADVVRQHLSKGLGFSREDRSTNVRRIGYIASEITKHGGICLVANIAPYKCDREYNRALIEERGGVYVEVYVSTPLSVCEERDVKNLYKKARQGIIKQFTGISDPYEAPTNAEMAIDSSSNIREKVNTIVKYLQENHYVVQNPVTKICS